jgi:hypothetical protein
MVRVRPDNFINDVVDNVFEKDLSKLFGPYTVGPAVESVAYGEKYGQSTWIEIHNDTTHDLVIRFFHLMPRFPDAKHVVARGSSPILLGPGCSETLDLPHFSTWTYVAVSSGTDLPQQRDFIFQTRRNYVLRFKMLRELVDTVAAVPSNSALRGIAVATIKGVKFRDDGGPWLGETRVVISRVDKGSLAAKAGLRVGDWIAKYGLVTEWPEGWNSVHEPNFILPETIGEIESIADFHTAASVCVPNCALFVRDGDARSPTARRRIVGPPVIQWVGYTTGDPNAYFPSARAVPLPQSAAAITSSVAAGSGSVASSIATQSRGMAPCSIGDGYQTVHFSDGAVYSGSFQNCRPVAGPAQYQRGSTALSGYAQPIDDHTVNLRTDAAEVTITLDIQIIGR